MVILLRSFGLLVLKEVETIWLFSHSSSRIPNGGYSRNARRTQFDTYVAIKTKVVYAYTENETIYTKKHQNNKYTKMRLKVFTHAKTMVSTNYFDSSRKRSTCKRKSVIKLQDITKFTNLHVYSFFSYAEK